MTRHHSIDMATQIPASRRPRGAYHRFATDRPRARLVDLLPDRQSNTVAEWLRDHAALEVISRDRAGACAKVRRR